MFKTTFFIGFLIILTSNIFAQQNGAPDNVGPDSPSSVQLPLELDRVLREYEQGWRSKDADALATLFTPDGFILRPGYPPVQGRTAIAEAYRNSGGELHLRALSFAQADSIAYIIGGYKTVISDPDAGKFILTLRMMSDGKWYITADMDNPNR